MTKTQKIFDQMISQNQAVFDTFLQIHNRYIADPRKFRAEFNRQGENIQSIIRKYENLLCGQSENGGYGRYSGNLADKFWALIREKFPKIDEVGLL